MVNIWDPRLQMYPLARCSLSSVNHLYLHTNISYWNTPEVSWCWINPHIVNNEYSTTWNNRINMIRKYYILNIKEWPLYSRTRENLLVWLKVLNGVWRIIWRYKHMKILRVHIRLCLGFKHPCTNSRGPTKGTPRRTQTFLKKAIKNAGKRQGQNHAPTTDSGSVVGVMSPHLYCWIQGSIPVLS